MKNKKKFSHSIVIGASDSIDAADIYYDGTDDQIEIQNAIDEQMKNTLQYQAQTLKESLDQFIFEFVKATGIIWIMDRLETFLRKQTNKLNGMKNIKTNYAICIDCNQEMTPGNGCTIKEIMIQKETYFRIPYGEDGFHGDQCHDCNVFPGQIHHLGCDVERCPKCGGQLISCDCEGKEID